MSGTCDGYSRKLAPLYTLLSCFTPPDKVKAIRSYFEKPSQMMLNLMERVPEGYFGMGGALNRMSRRQIQRKLIRAVRKDHDRFAEKIALLVALVDYFSMLGSQGHTSHDGDEVVESTMDGEYELITRFLENEFGGLISSRASVASGEVGATLLGSFWEGWTGNIEREVPPTAKRILALDGKDFLDQAYRLLELSNDLAGKEIQAVNRCLTRSLLERHYGVNTGNTRKTFVDPEIARQRDHSAEDMFKQEEAILAIGILIDEMFTNEKPRKKQLVLLLVSYKCEELSKEVYENELKKIGYTPSAARKELQRMRERYPNWKDQLKVS